MKPTRRAFAKSIAAGFTALFTGNFRLSANETQPPRTRPPTRPVGGKVTGVGLAESDASHVPTSGILSPDGQSLSENARDIPVAGACDVIVCGGGPAGIAAALSAARAGASTALLELNGCIGGVWTAGMLSLIIDSRSKTGIMSELLARLQAESAGHWISGGAGGSLVYDPETMKRLLEEILVTAGVKIRLHTRVVGAVVDSQNRLSTILTESKSGREAWTARSFIDCTGDGDLAAQAGCEFDFGRPGDQATQPASLMALLTGVSTKEIARFVRGEAEPLNLGNPKHNLLEEFRRAGVEPSYTGPTFFSIRDGLIAMMANHQYGVSAIDADHITRATLEARREVHHLVDSLRKLGGPWSGIRIVTTGEQIGTREARRIRGRYEVTGEDLRNGTRFEDGICHVEFGIDVHSVDPSKTKAIESKPHPSKPYDIPLRALIPKDVDGLMTAGRCISGDFIAHSSYRVTGNAVAMGEAAGLTSALAAANKTLPHDVPFSELKTALKRARQGSA